MHWIVSVVIAVVAFHVALASTAPPSTPQTGPRSAETELLHAVDGFYVAFLASDAASVADMTATDYLQTHVDGKAQKVHGLGTTKFRDVPRPHELDYVLRAGEVISFESILVVPGLGQATVEDNILVLDGGCEVLSTAARRLW